MKTESSVIRDRVVESTIVGESTRAEVIQRGSRPAIRKIPPELRRRRNAYRSDPSFIRRVLRRLREDSQFLRSAVQLAFALLCIWIGIEFYFFVRWGMSGGSLAYVQRPPGAEGFLPISALMSLKYFALSGIVNTIHPAGLFIFVGILTVSLLAKKAFCSWLCPIGTLSESLWNLGARLFGRTVLPPRWLDLPLRSLKYLLLLFFVYVVWVMDEFALRMFIESPYNQMADVKMYLFFARMTSFAVWTIIVLMLLSLVIRNFWCRFLCPYGALLGLTSLLSPLKVTRNSASCVDCKLCTKACPAGIPVHRLSRVRSDECTNCLACVEVCPVRNTLNVQATTNSRPIPAWVFGALVVGIFAGITGLAMLAGRWQNGIAKQSYLEQFQVVDSPLYEHQRGLR
jgi:polyferredoxin